MASIPVINIKIIGTGNSKIGIWLLILVAKTFRINLEANVDAEDR